MYSISFKFNGETFKKRNESVEDALMQVKPEQLHTEMYVTVKDGKNIIERKLNLKQAQRVFRDEFDRKVFIQNLLLA